MERIVDKIAEYMIDYCGSDWNLDINHFDWVPGVGLYGIWKAYEAGRDKKYLDFLTDWFCRHLMEAYDNKTVNSAAPLLTAISLYTETKDAELLRVCIDLAEYVLHDAPRTVDGGLEHTVTEPVPGFSDQVWADTLFMVCIFMAKLGAVTGREEYKTFAAEQLRIHQRLLAAENGLYYHGYNGAAKNHMSAVCWGRANAWIVYASMEILNQLGDFDGRERLTAGVKKHIEALAGVQRHDGGFGTILDDDSSYTEISATAGISAGIRLAVEAGIVDKSYKKTYRAAAAAVRAAVLPDGSVGGVSTGTPVMPDAEAYKNIAVCPTLYGQGMAIIALVTLDINEEITERGKVLRS